MGGMFVDPVIAMMLFVREEGRWSLFFQSSGDCKTTRTCSNDENIVNEREGRVIAGWREGIGS